MRQIDVIADPVRLRVLRHLAESGRATARELADAAEVHVNTVRPHLQALESAGVIRTDRAASEGPGRPAVDYLLSDAAVVGDTDFRRLAELLTTTLARLEPSDEELRRTGADWGRYLLGRPGAGDVRSRLPAVLGELGFAATVTDDGVELSGCPCPLVSPERPDIVCRLASGAIEGVLAAAGSRLRPGEERHDTAARRCSVQLIQVDPRRA